MILVNKDKRNGSDYYVLMYDDDTDYPLEFLETYGVMPVKKEIYPLIRQFIGASSHILRDEDISERQIKTEQHIKEIIVGVFK